MTQGRTNELTIDKPVQLTGNICPVSSVPRSTMSSASTTTHVTCSKQSLHNKLFFVKNVCGTKWFSNSCVTKTTATLLWLLPNILLWIPAYQQRAYLEQLCYKHVMMLFVQSANLHLPITTAATWDYYALTTVFEIPLTKCPKKSTKEVLAFNSLTEFVVSYSNNLMIMFNPCLFNFTTSHFRAFQLLTNSG